MQVRVARRGSDAGTLYFRCNKPKLQKEPLMLSALYLESLNGWCQVHSDLVKTPEASFFLSIVKKNEDTLCGSTVCLCKEPSGQFVWEEAEEVQYCM